MAKTFKDNPYKQIRKPIPRPGWIFKDKNKERLEEQIEIEEGILDYLKEKEKK
jgi:hypothetical protein